MVGGGLFAEPFNVIGAGAVFAVVLRWLLKLEVAVVRAAGIGAVSCGLIPLIRLHLVPPLSMGSSADFALGAAVACWLLVIAHSINTH